MIGIGTLAWLIATSLTPPFAWSEFNRAFAALFRLVAGRCPTSAELAAGQWNYTRAQLDLAAE